MINQSRRILFRTAARASHGLDGLARCSALARALAARGTRVRMLVRGDEWDVEFAAAQGVEAVLLPPSDAAHVPVRFIGDLDADAVVVDDDDVSPAAFVAARAQAPHVVYALVTHVGGRSTPADVVIDGAMGAETSDYAVGPDCLRLLGAGFMLLPDRFDAEPVRTYRNRVERVLIITGAADTACLAAHAVRATRRALAEARIEVVRGPLVDVVSDAALAQAADSGVRCLDWQADLRVAMLSSDLAVAAADWRLYELAATGTPTVAVTVTADQQADARALERAGMLWMAGAADEPAIEDRIAGRVWRVAHDARLRQSMAKAGRRAVDGRGAGRVADALLDCVARRSAERQPC